MFAAEWPLKWPFGKKRDKEPTNDPFLGYGAEQQRQLAMQIAGPQAAVQPPPPATQKYPWPSPVDSHAQVPLADAWGPPPQAPAAPPQAPAAPGQAPTQPTNPALAQQPSPAEANPPATAQAPASPGQATVPATPPANSASLFTAPQQQTSKPQPGSPPATSQASQIPISAPPVTQPLPRGELEKTSSVLAIVGDQSILYGDIAGQINEMLAPYAGQVPEEQIEMQRDLLVQRFLPRVVDNKILFLDFLRRIPADKMPEIEQDLFRQYNETQLPKLLEKTGLHTAAELDDYLRGLGSSLSKQQRLFLEQVMRHEAVRTQVTVDKEVSHEEMLDYYREHSSEFEFEAKVRWEHLMVLKSNFGSNAEAYQALVQMGNEVLGGAPFEAVAKRSSQGPNAAEGGAYDWTTRGSLRSKQIDELIFTLPPGKLSRIVDDEDGYHILRVVERVDAGKQQFVEVQETIKDKIRELRFEQETKEYLDRLRQETYVWTVFDDLTSEVSPVGYEK